MAQYLEWSLYPYKVLEIIPLKISSYYNSLPVLYEDVEWCDSSMMYLDLYFTLILDDVSIVADNIKIFSSNAVINTFPTNPFTLSCLGAADSRSLQWEIRNVSLLNNGELTLAETENLAGINVTYMSRTNSFFFNQSFIFLSLDRSRIGFYSGYYSCRSRQSNSTVEVFVTLRDPLWQLVTPPHLEVSMGVEVIIAIQYADRSTGYRNLGSGFVYGLRFLPCVATDPDVMLEAGMTDTLSNELTFSFHTMLNVDSGEYLWNGEFGWWCDIFCRGVRGEQGVRHPAGLFDRD